MKKLSIVLMITILCCLFTGCSNKAVDELEGVLTDVLSKESGKISYLSTLEKDKERTEYTINLSYSYQANNDFLYSLTQYDKDNQPIYYEFNNGDIYEEWLIGKGITTYKKGDKNFTMYSKKNPHKYMNLVASVCNRNLIKKCKVETTDTISKYIVTYNEKAINKDLYKDDGYKIKSKIISFTKDQQKGLTDFSEEIELIDNKNNPYGTCSLNVTFSDSDSKEIIKPTIE